MGFLCTEFLRIRTIFDSGLIRENTVQRKLVLWHIFHSGILSSPVIIQFLYNSYSLNKLTRKFKKLVKFLLKIITNMNQKQMQLLAADLSKRSFETWKQKTTKFD